jgi:hypothetical protein
MKAPPTPEDEVYRLDALRSLDLLDTPPEAAFDALVRLGRGLFGAPICLVSLIDEDRQWFKACVGLETSETSREISFCGHAILQSGVFVVLDATRDERFFDNPLVTGGPLIRFYAGAPIRLPSGYQIGTVCIIDAVPRAEFGETERQLLADLAAMTVGSLALRAVRGDLDQARSALDRYKAALQMVPVPLAMVSGDGVIEDANPDFDALCRTNSSEEDQAAAGQARLTEALGIPAAGWSHERSDELTGEEGFATVSTPQAVLRIYPDLAGFVVMGEAKTR